MVLRSFLLMFLLCTAPLLRAELSIEINEGKVSVSIKALGVDPWEKDIDKSHITVLDSKTKLQEYSLKIYKRLPVYRFLNAKGPKHNPCFKISVTIDKSKQFVGFGSSKKQAEQDAEEALSQAQARLDDRVAELEGRSDIDVQTMQIMVRNLQEVENRRLEVLSTNINTEKETRIQASRERMETQIRRIQTTIKTFAILLPPVPVFLVGMGIFFRRQRREKEGAIAANRLKE